MRVWVSDARNLGIAVIKKFEAPLGCCKKGCVADSTTMAIDTRMEGMSIIGLCDEHAEEYEGLMLRAKDRALEASGKIVQLFKEVMKSDGEGA